VPLAVVVLAAGKGKRMRSNLPKVLQPLAGRPLLTHVLDTARSLEPGSIHVVYGHGGEQVRKAARADDVRWHLQERQLGTGHAVAQALPDIDDGDDVLVVCADVPLIRPTTLRRLTASAARGRLAVLTAVVGEPTGYGRILRDEQDRVVRVVEEQDATDEERRVSEVNTGLMAAGARALRRWLGRLDNDNSQGEYYLTDIIAMAFEDGVGVEGVQAEDPDEVLGINDKAQLAVAERSLQRRIARDLMERGVTLADPERLDVRGTLTVGTDVFIDVGAVFEGDVHLGDGVHIGAHAVIADARLGDGCLVHPHTVMRGAAAGANCEIGPFARLRPGTELAARAKIGNFVEIKNSRIAEGSKVSHLSYIGDTTVGTSVNVGAGTITCNYDGAVKHRTVIGSGVFVGSGVMLVAPVEVGEGATIGAGSTIDKDVPAGELAIARVRQTIVKGWKRPVKPTERG
jgi:bifunctional UDP-N-acetylglucosamine pyrophosphorylase / glucosamine-1-phosphate N-acetyltransferase